MRLVRALSLIVLPLCAYSQVNNPQQDAFSSLRQEVQSRIRANDVPGLSIAVAQDGRIIWEQGFGWADLQGRKAATPETPFYVASITKSFTATAIMRLKEDGKLRLDKPVNDYLGVTKLHSPQWNAQEATVRRVMSHTGGLTTFTHWCTLGAAGCNATQDIQHYGLLVWPPGQVFDYSNLGYGVLGEVISRTSSQPFSSYLRAHIFQPLRMKHCSFSFSTAAARYDQNTHARSQPSITSHPGASGLYCSAHDLLLFGMFNLGEQLNAQKVIHAGDVAELHKPQTATRSQYGLGWWLKEQSGYQLVLAQGGTTDAYASLTLVLGKNITVVVVANSYSQFVSDLSDKILSTMLPDFSSATGRPAQPATKSSFTAPGALVGKWSGQLITYAEPLNVTLEVHEDGTAVAQVGSESPPLAHVSMRPNHFYAQAAGVPELIDAPAGQYIIELDLGLYGDELMGAATAGPLPGRDGNQFPHWLKLTRAK